MNIYSTNKKPSSPSGFTLIELSIVLIITSILLATFFGVLRIYIQKQQEFKMEQRSYDIRRGIASFIADTPENPMLYPVQADDPGFNDPNRFPCPASLTAATTSLEFGLEQCPIPTDGSVTQAQIDALVPGTIENGVHIVAGGENGASRVLIGAVPTRTLGVDPINASDVYGNRFVYAVSINNVSNDRLYDDGRPVSDASGLIRVLSQAAVFSGDPLPVGADYRVFALVSHGPNSLGAYNYSSGRKVQDCNTNASGDGLNCYWQANPFAVFRERVSLDLAGDDIYDDTITFSLAGEGDNDTGWWEKINDTDNFIINKNRENDALNFVAVTDEGFIGIGTNDPQKKLHIIGEWGSGPSTQAAGITIARGYRAAPSNDGRPVFTPGGRNGIATGLRFEVTNNRNDMTYAGNIFGGLSDVNPNREKGYLSFFTKNFPGPNNTEKMRIDHDGNVGIGTETPQQPLHVMGAARIGTDVYMDEETETGQGNFQLGSALYPNYSGNLSGAGYLETPWIYTDGCIEGDRRGRSATAVCLGGTNEGGADLSYNGFTTGDEIALVTNGKTRLFVDGDRDEESQRGNIGIGTVQPWADLTIVGKVPNSGNGGAAIDKVILAVVAGDEDQWSRISAHTFGSKHPVFLGVKSGGTPSARTFAQNGDRLVNFRGYGGGVEGDPGAGIRPDGAGMSVFAEQNFTERAMGSGVLFSTVPNAVGTAVSVQAEERMRITHDGHVGIGEHDPERALHVTFNNDAGDGTNAQILVENIGSADSALGIKVAAGSGSKSVIHFLSRSNNINSVDTRKRAAFGFDHGEERYEFWTSAASGNWTPKVFISKEGNVDILGDLSVAGVINGTHSSDARLKDDLSVAAGLDILEKMQGYDFSWNEYAPDSLQGKRDSGVLAQELAAIPELAHLVHGTEGDLEKGETLSVNYNGLIPVLIESVKDLKAEMDALAAEKDAEIVALQSKSAELEERLAMVESVIQPRHSGFNGAWLALALMMLAGGYGLAHLRLREGR